MLYRFWFFSSLIPVCDTPEEFWKRNQITITHHDGHIPTKDPGWNITQETWNPLPKHFADLSPLAWRENLLLKITISVIKIKITAEMTYIMAKAWQESDTGFDMNGL